MLQSKLGPVPEFYLIRFYENAFTYKYMQYTSYLYLIALKLVLVRVKPLNTGSWSQVKGVIQCETSETRVIRTLKE